MRNLRIIAVLLVLSLVAFCLVSAPVFSSEHPWDADDGGSGGNETEGDTTIVPFGDDGSTSGQQEGGDLPWWNDLVAWFCQTTLGLIYQADDSIQQTTGQVEADVRESDGRVQIN